jgi:hypothetical protein
VDSSYFVVLVRSSKLIRCVLLWQVETIGDAYCVACGLHKPSSTHAQQCAWMALKMIETCATHHTHDGKPIKVSSGTRRIPSL